MNILRFNVQMADVQTVKTEMTLLDRPSDWYLEELKVTHRLSLWLLYINRDVVDPTPLEMEVRLRFGLDGEVDVTPSFPEYGEVEMNILDARKNWL